MGGLEEVEKELDLAGGEGLKLDIVRYPDGVKTHSEKSAKELIIILDSVHRLDFYRDRFFSESLPFSLRGIYKKKNPGPCFTDRSHIDSCFAKLSVSIEKNGLA